MKLGIVVTVLMLLGLSLPESFQAQLLNKPHGNQKHTRNVRVKKVINNVKSKTDKRELQAKKLIEKFIDGVFIKRNIEETFERLSLFEPCNQIYYEKNEGQCFLRDFPTGLGHSTNSRIAAMIWRYEFGAIYLILGNEPIQDSYPYASSEYNDLKTKVLEKNRFSDEVVGKENSKKDVEKRLDEIEKNFDEIEKLVFEQLNKSLYNENIKTLKKSIKVTKVIIKKRTFYEVSIKGLVFGFVLSVKNGEMKIIGIEDGI
jgi:hypothetical protein